MKRLAFLRTLLAIPLAGCMPRQWHGDALPPDTVTTSHDVAARFMHDEPYGRSHMEDLNAHMAEHRRLLNSMPRYHGTITGITSK